MVVFFSKLSLNGCFVKEREGDCDRECSSSRHRSERERDGEGKDRDKDRERRDKDKDRRDRDRDREHERREKDRERERERAERERSTWSRSRSERDRDREQDFDMRDGRRFRDKKEAAEPEADPERDQRTVFAYQMPLKATERDVYEFFSKAGKPIMAKEDHDASLIDDGNPKCQGHQVNKPNGINQSTALSDTSNETQPDLYIEFYDAMSVPMAIALSGPLLLGQPIMVKPSEAEKNLVQSNASGGAASVTGPYGAVDRKLYVGNLHFNMIESSGLVSKQCSFVASVNGKEGSCGLK
ncbi:hypothetical protein JHK87_022488 [Glycine soja]|nr:hypothetical protein JHK87_022488 [Glycine soja]